LLLRRRRFRDILFIAVAFAALYAATTRSPAGYEPSLARWYFDRGTDYDRNGDLPGAVEQYRKALEARFDYFEAHYNLGHALSKIGKDDQALHHWNAALALSPDSAPVHYNLALVYRSRGTTSRAIDHLEAASARRPESVNYHMELANLYLSTGQIDRSRHQYQQVLELEPDQLEATRNLAWILAVHPDVGSRDPTRAIELAEKATEQTDWSSPSVLDALAAAYAAAGRYSDAAATAERAFDLARAMGSHGLASSIQVRLEAYRAELDGGEP
jgi:tetratricopeptide (TPR) repeat protein